MPTNFPVSLRTPYFSRNLKIKVNLFSLVIVLCFHKTEIEYYLLMIIFSFIFILCRHLYDLRGMLTHNFLII